VNLQTKFNLALSGAFVIGLALAAGFAFKLAGDTARRDVLHEASLMASEGEGASAYTDQEVAPLLNKEGTSFAPQSIPFLAAQDQFRRVKKDWPDYSYKDAALNPTNPADKAADWEAVLINRFRADPSLKRIVSQRDTPTGPVLSLSKPIRISDPTCLQCHSTPDKAPPGMIALYGTAGGFGWKLNEAVGAQIVSVPMSVALAHANRSFLYFLGGLAIVFLVTLAALNVLLRMMVVRPVTAIARMADDVSLGKADVPEYVPKGNDEIASIFKQWAAPIRDLEFQAVAGATSAPTREPGGTDSTSFSWIGLDGFGFMQDPLEYGSRTHHSNMDLYDRVQVGDVMQGAAIEAWFVYNTATRPSMLPRLDIPAPLSRSAAAK